MAQENGIKAIEIASVHRITSGQVVIDLQTAVKELVENSIDAGATNVEVRFKQYGLTSIEVIDNGSGIAPEDYESVALKHHTSKLKVFTDLTSLVSFGFRGEALSSLCSLCETVSLTTARTQEIPVGTELVFDKNGKIQSKNAVARQRGTTVTLSSIFKPLAVRRKELERNIKREFGKALNLLNAYALGPCTKEGGVRLTVSNQPDGGKKAVLLRTDGSASMTAAVSALWGPKALTNIIDLDLSFDIEPSKTAMKRLGSLEDDAPSTPSSLEVRIKGLTSKFSIGCGRTGTDRQFFYVNGRPCNLSKVQKAFNEVYRTFSVNQSPFLLVDVILPTETCDINVSPDKRTIFIQSEENLIAGLKVCLEETFASSRSTFDVRGTQMTQTQLHVENTQATQPVRRSSRRESNAPAEESETEGKENEDEIAEVPTNARRQATPAESEAVAEKHTRGRDRSSMEVPLFISDDDLEQDTFRPGEHLTTQPGESRGLNPPGAPEDDQPSYSSRTLSADQAMILDDLGTHQQDDDGDLDASMDVDTSDNIEASSSLSIAHHPSTPPTSQPRPSRSDRSDQEEAQQSITSSVIQLPISSWALKKTLSMSDSASRNSTGREKRKEAFHTQTTLNTAGTSWGRQLKASQRSIESEEPEERVSPPRKRHRPADSPPAPNAHHRRSISPSVRKASSRSKPRASSALERSEPSSFDVIDIDTPSAPEDTDYKEAEAIALSSNTLTNDPPEPTEPTPHLVEFVRTNTDDDQVTLRFDLDRLSGVYANAALALELHSSQTGSDAPDTIVPADAGVANVVDNEKAADALSRIIDKKDFATMEVLGQFNKGFVIVRRRKQVGDPDEDDVGESLTDAMDDLFIVDQHAADEKYNFETLQQTTVIRSQKLYTPLPLELAAAEELLALDNLEILRKNGYELEADEDRNVGQKLLVTAQPVSKTTNFDMKDLEEIITLLSSSPAGRMVRCSKARAMFAMRACRSSVMIGKALQTNQMTSIVRHMGTMDQPWNCPHGRPTMRHLSNISNFGQGISRFKARRVDWDKLAIPAD